MRKVIVALVPFVFAQSAFAAEEFPTAAAQFGALAQPAVVAKKQPRQRGSQDAAIGQYDAMIAAHAAANGIPESLIRRVIKRESGGRAHVVHAGNYGLMQIKPATARGVGYAGSAAGLLDANTNMTYAVKYLAGAYRAAGGNESRAVAYYASGYYYAAKRQGLGTLAATKASTFEAATPFSAVTAATAAAPAPTTALGEATPVQVASADGSFAMTTTTQRRRRH